MSLLDTLVPFRADWLHPSDQPTTDHSAPPVRVAAVICAIRHLPDEDRLLLQRINGERARPRGVGLN